MITKETLISWAQKAAREGRPFMRWWLDCVARDRDLCHRFLNAEVHNACLAAYNEIRPPVPRAKT
jgi:hypothetical protein